MENYKKRVKIERSEEKEVKNQLQLQVSELKIQVSGLEYEVSQKDKAAAELQKENKVMISENKQLSEFVQSYTEQKEKELSDHKKSHSEQISTLNHKIKSLEADLTDVLAKGQKKALESEETLKQIKQVQVEVIDQLKEENLKLAKALDENGSKLAQKDLEIASQSQDNIKLQSRVNEVTAECSTLTKNLQEIQLELERVNELISAAEVSIKERDRQINQMSQERSDMHKSLLMSQERHEDLEKLIKSLTNQKNATAGIEVENMQLKSRLDSANNELASLRMRLSQSQSVVITSHSQTHPFGQQPAYGAPSSPQSQQEQALRRDNDDLRKQIGLSTSEVLAAKQQLQRRDQELESLRGEHSALLHRVGGFSSQETVASQKLSTLEDRIRLLQSELIRKSEECETYKTQAIELRATAEELVDEFKQSQLLSDTWKSQNGDLRSSNAELSTLKEEHADLQKELAKRLDHNRKLAEAFEKQRAELFKAQELQKESQVELSVLREEVTRLKNKPSKPDKPEPKKVAEAKKPPK